MVKFTAFCEVANGIYGFRVDFGREIGCQSGKSQKGDRVGMERQGVHAHYIKSGDHTVGFGAYANFTYNEVLRVDPDWCGFGALRDALVTPRCVRLSRQGTCSAAAAPELLAMMPLRKAWHPWGEGAGRCTTRSGCISCRLPPNLCLNPCLCVCSLKCMSECLFFFSTLWAPHTTGFCTVSPS